MDSSFFNGVDASSSLVYVKALLKNIHIREGLIQRLSNIVGS